VDEEDHPRGKKGAPKSVYPSAVGSRGGKSVQTRVIFKVEIGRKVKEKLRRQKGAES